LLSNRSFGDELNPGAQGMSAAGEALVSGNPEAGSNVDAAAAKASAIAFAMNKALKKHSDRIVSTVNTEVGITW
jgi:hypothetical protein